jgi:hypothetical protein
MTSTNRGGAFWTAATKEGNQSRKGLSRQAKPLAREVWGSLCFKPGQGWRSRIVGLTTAELAILKRVS